MQLSLLRWKELFPHLNERTITVEDFYQIADNHQVTIFELRIKKRGIAVTDLTDNSKYVCLKKGLNRLHYLETLAHEIAHIVCGNCEFEANAFRLIAIIPESCLCSYDWLDENPTKYAFSLWQERLRVKFLHRI